MHIEHPCLAGGDAYDKIKIKDKDKKSFILNKYTQINIIESCKYNKNINLFKNNLRIKVVDKLPEW